MMSVTEFRRSDLQSALRSTLDLRLVSWLLAALALFLIAAWIYWPGLTGGFIFDDIPNLVENPSLRVSSLAWQDWIIATFSSQSGPLQRPLAMFTFALNHYFTGLDPRPMKLTNLAIHLVNGALVLGLSRQLIVATVLPPNQVPAKWIALFIAALWTLHPINLMGVLFVVQRMESLCHTFVFAGLWLYALGRSQQLRGRPGWFLVLTGLTVFTALGALSKESAVLLPLYAFCLELCIFRFRMQSTVGDRRIHILFVIVLVVPALAGLYRVLPQAFSDGAFASRNFTLGERLLTESRVVLDYLRWSVLPDLGQLSLFHDDYPISHGVFNPPSTALGLISIPLMLTGAWIFRTRRPLVALGILWFLAAQVLTATFISLELVFEHRNYFASLGICLVLADFLLLNPLGGVPRAIGAVCALALLLLFASITHLRALEWSNPIRFAMSEAQKHPTSPRATYHLAGQLVALSEYQADSPLIGPTWKALEAAREAPGSGLLPLQASLIFAARTGTPQPQEWWQELRHRLRTQPLDTQNRVSIIALNNCAVEEVCAFPKDEMLQVFATALEKGPDAGMLSIYGKYALYVLGDARFAQNLWRESAARGPQNPQFQINLAMLCIALGEYPEARQATTRLRALGILGQYDKQADELDAEMTEPEQTRGRLPADAPN